MSDRWLVYVPGDGWHEYEAEAEARAHFDDLVQVLRDEAASDGEWADDADDAQLYLATVVARTVLVPDENSEDGAWFDLVAEETRSPLAIPEAIAALREARPDSPVEVCYHPDADPGDGSGWAVVVGDRRFYGQLVDALAEAVAEVRRD